MIHHGLERGRAIGETEKHDKGFKQSFVGNEGSFPFITFFDLDIIVPPSNI